MNIVIIANVIINEKGFSGGERILIECAKRWAEMGHRVTIFTPRLGEKIYKNYQLNRVNYIVWSSLRYERWGLLMVYLSRTIVGCLKACTTKLPEGSIIYSSSDFWPDSLPAIIMKWKNRGCRWIAGFYLFAPNPLRGFREEGKLRFPSLRNIIYYLSQRPIYWLIKRFAEMVFVTSEPDVSRFITRKRGRDRIVVVRGGVDVTAANRYLASSVVMDKRYDACFVGRFHPQKGVVELIDIWSEVCKAKPDARLAIVGVGSLEKKVRGRIRLRQLEKNVHLLGFKDGEEKYEVFKVSRLMLHPALYDSGGMAACEGMAWGMPAVGFDLQALKTYYPKGMLKAPKGDLRGFARLILDLLNNQELYHRIRRDARELALEEWDWDKRASLIMKKMTSAFE